MSCRFLQMLNLYMALLHEIALTLIPHIGDRQARKLIAAFGGAREVFAADFPALMAIPGIGDTTAKALLGHRVLDKAARYLETMQKQGVRILSYRDPEYPKRLKHCSDAPLVLYFKGATCFNEERVLAIVGARNASLYGKQLCQQLIEALAPYRVLVVSGLAYGIDITAHRECLRQNIATVAVLGHGLDRIYPSAHRDIASQMLANGGLLSEFLPGTRPDKANFPKRNRIIAGLCDATIVVEASAKGGALITADIANSYFREVFAFPGRVSDPASVGCHFLIKTQRAALITGVDDLVYQMGWAPANVVHENERKGELIPDNDDISADAAKIITVIGNTPMHIEDIAAQTGFPLTKLNTFLLEMELAGYLKALAGNMYSL